MPLKYKKSLYHWQSVPSSVASKHPKTNIKRVSCETLRTFGTSASPAGNLTRLSVLWNPPPAGYVIASDSISATMALQDTKISPKKSNLLYRCRRIFHLLHQPTLTANIVQRIPTEQLTTPMLFCMTPTLAFQKEFLTDPQGGPRIAMSIVAQWESAQANHVPKVTPVSHSRYCHT